VPFVRASRDRRGYEHFYLIHTIARRGRPPRAQVLYWYRTPPGIKVGRAPFDEEVQRALEAQFPDIAFDWPKLIETKPPPIEAESWRERRRAERAAREIRDEHDEDEPTPAKAIEHAVESAAAKSGDSSQSTPIALGSTAGTVETGSDQEPHSAPSIGPRRRRRGRRRGRDAAARPQDAAEPATSAPDPGVASADVPEDPTDEV
jgi:hypothetical protein